MIYAKILGILFSAALLIYYILCMCQCFGLIKFTTKEDISFSKIFIPFYYFFR